MVSVSPNLFFIFLVLKRKYMLFSLHTIFNLVVFLQQNSNSKGLIGGVNHVPRNEETLSGINSSKVVRLSELRVKDYFKS